MTTHIDLTVRDDGKAEFERGSVPGILRIYARDGENRPDGSVTLYARPDVLADLLVELSTWPDVVNAAGERFRDAILGADVIAQAPELSEIAKDYFRKGFAQYGLSLVDSDVVA
jgi:hypothetical protein